MEYRIEYMRQALEDSKRLKANEPKAFKKLEKLVAELRKHPQTGTGHPEQLKGEPKGRWSRRITARHWLIYEIHDMEVIVIVLAAYGHYDDK